MARLKFTLESLSTSETITAQLWRAAREIGRPATHVEIAEHAGIKVQKGGGGGRSRGPIARLVATGWMTRREMTDEEVRAAGARQYRYLYEATIGADALTSRPGEFLEATRKELNRIIKLAHDARYTGLAVRMGAALADVEKALGEVRDTLYTSSFSSDDAAERTR